MSAHDTLSVCPEQAQADELSLYDRIKAGLVKVHRQSAPVLRFWWQVDKNGPIHPVCGQCWVWTGCKADFGHGHFRVNGHKTQAHRYSYELHAGAISGRLCVLHRCDNPSCVNPDHLFLGTRVDNNLDRDQKGRKGDHKGTCNGRAKLTESQAGEIRQRYRRGSADASIRVLAREYGVSRSAIQYLVSGQHWRHVG